MPTGNLPSQFLLLRLTAGGALNPTFGTGGVTAGDVGPLSDLGLPWHGGPTGAANSESFGAVALQADGRIVVGSSGYFIYGRVFDRIESRRVVMR